MRDDLGVHTHIAARHAVDALYRGLDRGGDVAFDTLGGETEENVDADFVAVDADVFDRFGGNQIGFEMWLDVALDGRFDLFSADVCHALYLRNISRCPPVARRR